MFQIRNYIVLLLLLIVFVQCSTVVNQTAPFLSFMLASNQSDGNVSSQSGISTTTSSSENLYDVPWFLIAILTALYGTISILAVLGNGLIVYVVLKSKRMHNVTNYFISNLAMADIVIGVFATPFQFQAALLQYWVLPKIMCKVAPFATTLSVNVSIFTLVAISLDRYYVILYPLKPKLRVKNCFIILLLIWIIALLLSSIHLYNFYVDDTTSVLPRCEILDPDLYHYHVLFLVLVQYVIPFLIITLTYFRIGYHIYFDKSPDTVNKKQEQNKRKVIKMIFIVVNLFMLCWGPLQLYNFLQFVNPSINEYRYINILWFCANWFAMSNSAYNVFIYGICSARYKHEFRRVLSCFPCVQDETKNYNPVNTQKTTPDVNRRNRQAGAMIRPNNVNKPVNSACCSKNSTINSNKLRSFTQTEHVDSSNSNRVKKSISHTDDVSNVINDENLKTELNDAQTFT